MNVTIVAQQPTDSICGLKEFLDKLEREDGVQISCLSYTPEGDVVGEIKSQRPDLLITLDLSGFEQCTLTDSIAYNLLSCKQFHLLLHRELPNEFYLGRPLSMAMFFYCAGEDYCAYLKQRYPDLPYLKELTGWREETVVQTEIDRQIKEGNMGAFYAAYREVLREGLLVGKEAVDS